MRDVARGLGGSKTIARRRGAEDVVELEGSGVSDSAGRDSTVDDTESMARQVVSYIYVPPPYRPCNLASQRLLKGMQVSPSPIGPPRLQRSYTLYAGES